MSRNRMRAGAIAWAASAALLPVQAVVAAQWPDGYSLTAHAISDLGVTVCGSFSEGGEQAREVCSPWHALFNTGTVVSGLCIAIGALLLHGRWPARAGKIGTIFLSLAGLCVAVIGFAPWDLRPALHDGAAVGQAVLQWTGMILLAVAAGRGLFRRLTLTAAAISIAGLFAFLTALDGTPLPLLPFGIAERLSFDTMTVWTALAGVAALVAEHPGRRRLTPSAGRTLH